jgi:hypothetical protein
MGANNIEMGESELEKIEEMSTKGMGTVERGGE